MKNKATSQSRTAQLHALKAALAKEFDKKKPGNPFVETKGYSRLVKEISALEDSFILYQGQEIDAEKVNYVHWCITTSTEDLDGEEDLFRDANGRYYLRRQLSGNDRVHVHRININAAILWAATRLNSQTLDLRNDAAALLMESRSYSDPHPTHLGADQRALLSTAVSETGSAPSTRYGVSPSILEAATRYAATAGRTLEQMVVEFVENAANMAPGGETVAPEPTADAQVVGGCHRFTFDYPATEKVCGRRRTVEVTDEQMARVGELAATFSLTPSQFLRGLADCNDLPGQPRRRSKLRDSLQAQHVAFACMDEAMAKRIERAAQSHEQTAAEFVTDAVSGDVDMWEEAMLVHPVTGELLEAEYENLYTEVDCTYTAPRVGRGGELQFKSHPGRKYVRFGAYLTPEQLERVEFPHMVSNCATNEEVPTLLVPFDEDGTPFLEVAGKAVGIGHAFQPVEREPDGMLVRLDSEATALVRRYLGVTAWDYTSADVVNGCVVQELEGAFDNQAEAERMTGLANEEFHDGPWGYIDEAIYDAVCRRTGDEEGASLKDENDGRTIGTRMVRIEIRESKLSGEELDARDRAKYRRTHARPSDVALLAAPQPEDEEPLAAPDKPGAGTPDGEEAR